MGCGCGGAKKRKGRVGRAVTASASTATTAATQVEYRVKRPDGTMVEDCCASLLEARQKRIETGGAILPLRSSA